MTGEVVKYKNDLNKFSFKGLTGSELDIVFAIFHKFKEQNATEIRFHKEQLKELIQYSRTDLPFGEFAFKSFQKLQRFLIECPAPHLEKGRMSVIVFPIVAINDKTDEISVSITPIIADYLNAIEDNFTRFELAEFVNLNGTYAKTLYRLLKQYRSTGWVQFEWQQFKQLMGISENYRMDTIDKQILKASIKELTKPQDLFDNVRQPFVNLKYEKMKKKGRGRGGQVVGIRFTFMPWDEQEQLNAPKEPTAQQQTGNFVPLNHKIIAQKPSIKAQGSK